jgi:aminoglycoside phosphotransferase (APT) family kinase protein
LKKVYSKAPAPLLFCENEKILGAPFYVMERLSGIILRPRMPPEMVPAPELMAQIAGSVIDNLVDLHNLDYKSAGLADIGKPSGYVERQVRGWADRYLRSQTDKLTDMDKTAAWLIANLPPESTASLIHNDYKYDNLILNSDNWTEISVSWIGKWPLSATP